MNRKYKFTNDSLKTPLRQRILLILLDYDGTLVPITSRPEKAIISPSAQNLLSKLNQLPGVTIGIISGRSLSDLKKMVGIKGLIYAGNHGIEWEIGGKKGKLKILQGAEGNLSKIRMELNIISRKFKGAILEDKEYILSVHYRLVKQELLEPFRKYLKYLVAPYKNSGALKMTRGKKVYEIKLNLKWDKGDFIEFLLNNNFRQNNLLTVYIGDDVTDEDVFVKHRKKIVTVKVGLSLSKAEYYLSNQQEVIKLLEFILKIRSRG